MPVYSVVTDFKVGAIVYDTDSQCPVEVMRIDVTIDGSEMNIMYLVQGIHHPYKREKEHLEPVERDMRRKFRQVLRHGRLNK